MNSPPWWVAYAFIFILVAGSFVFTLQGRLTPAEWLAFAAALGFRAPQSSGPVEQMDVQAETANVTEKPYGM